METRKKSKTFCLDINGDKEGGFVQDKSNNEERLHEGNVEQVQKQGEKRRRPRKGGVGSANTLTP